ncbi:TonB family protein [Massilia forsythiae]|uniref:TonB family protein n=1 Tax=Massilia forsythiae TaxID=2728020 RepID=A0A7Z2W139_9BURK|nr:energy transducer TonB [Massilia forsythiae]QJE02944.1 TonB family protein [Massilia forsythiae]
MKPFLHCVAAAITAFAAASAASAVSPDAQAAAQQAGADPAAAGVASQAAGADQGQSGVGADPAAAPAAVPIPDTCARPPWPPEARRYELEGRTRLRYRIAADGSVADAAIEQGSGWALLDEASLKTLRGCSFPAQQAADAQGTVRQVVHVWAPEGEGMRPALVAGSCAPSTQFAGFAPLDGSSDGGGIRVRMLVNTGGAPFGVKAERGAFPADQVEDARQYAVSCRFTPASGAGRRSDAMFGRVLLK